MKLERPSDWHSKLDAVQPCIPSYAVYGMHLGS